MVNFNAQRAGRWLGAGAIIGALIPIILSWVGKIPGITVTNQATIAIEFSTPGTALADWLLGIISIDPNIPNLLGIPIQSILIGALSGAMLFVGGAFIADALNILKGSKAAKIGWILFVGGLATTWIVSGFSFPGFTVLIGLGVSAAISGFLYFQGFKLAGQEKLIPD